MVFLYRRHTRLWRYLSVARALFNRMSVFGRRNDLSFLLVTSSKGNQVCVHLTFLMETHFASILPPPIPLPSQRRGNKRECCGYMHITASPRDDDEEQRL